MGRANVKDGAESAAPLAFNVVVKPRGALCNLACSYCFYLPKKDLYPGSDARMTDALLESYLRQHLQAHCPPEVTFDWQGGEPTLMGIDFFRRAVALQERFRREGTRVRNTLQTNATTLDDDWCRFFREEGFLIGVSLDGPRECHDAYRVDRGGAPTFDRVMDGVALLRKHSVAFNVLASVHAANAERPLEVYRFLRDEVGPSVIQFIPIVEQDGKGGATPRSVSGRRYGEFLIAVFDGWVRRDVGRVFVQIFDLALGVWLGQPSSLCVFAETCGDVPALEHNGDLYSCDHFVDPPHRLGNIAERPLDGLIASPRQRRFGQDKRDALPRACRECPVRFICNGGCPKDRFLATADGEPGLNFLCEGYRAFFTHIDRPMRAMAGLIGQRRPPSEVMAMVPPRG